MTTEINRKVILKSRPDGYPQLTDFEITEQPIPQPREGEALIRALWLSLDPYMRGRMRDTASYAPSIQLGDVIVGGVVGRVIASRTPRHSRWRHSGRPPRLARIRPIRRPQPPPR